MACYYLELSGINFNDTKFPFILMFFKVALQDLISIREKMTVDFRPAYFTLKFTFFAKRLQEILGITPTLSPNNWIELAGSIIKSMF